MISTMTLLTSILTLFLYLLIGFIAKKSKAVTDGFGLHTSRYILYVAQIAMLLYGYLRPQNTAVTLGILQMFFTASAAHLLAYFIARLFFKKAPDKVRDILVFGTMFSNAGYMGIPVIQAVLGSEYVIYATIYIGVFNLFSFSLGRVIYTHDKSYISVKGMFVNPGVIPVGIGLFLYFSGIGGWMQSQLNATGFWAQCTGVVYKALGALSDTVAPLSMIIIGVRLAETKLRSVLTDCFLYLQMLTRLIIVPLVLWACIKPLEICGLITPEVLAVSIVLVSTPAAAATTIYSELYGQDSVYAGQLVSTSTLLSAVTMPLVSLLLFIM